MGAKQSAVNPGGMLWGALFAALAAMLFACKGLLAKQLYAENVDYALVVAIRATLALPLFWAFAVYREGVSTILSTPRRAMLAAASAGVLCYYVGAVLDFFALTMIDASIERVLLFSYPAMVVLFTSLRAGRLPSRRVVAATLLTYVGIFCAVGGLDRQALRANLLGAALVLASALSYAFYFLIGEKFTRQIGSSRFTLFAMTAAALALAAHMVVRHGVGAIAQIPRLGWWWLALLAVLCMFIPALLQAEGVRRIGAQRGAVVSTVGPPTTVLMAWAFLGERLSAWQLTGVALIVCSIVLLEVRQESSAPTV